MSNCEVVKNAIISGQLNKIGQLVNDAIASGLPPQKIIDDGLIAGMLEVGTLWKNSEIYLPEVIVSARAMHEAINLLRPLLAKGQSKVLGIVVLGSVKGDVHDIGKNLVGLMLEGAGFEVFDIGVDKSASDFIDAAINKKADFVALSSLLSTTMKEIPLVIEALKQFGLREKVKVVIGGAPVTNDFSKKVGADGYAPDAIMAVEECKRLMNK
jgi:5-methyltetrahydrofolate--homocysteine methyltransferase